MICPKCGSEMTEMEPEPMYWDDYPIWVCKCGHEKKVKK